MPSSAWAAGAKAQTRSAAATARDLAPRWFNLIPEGLTLMEVAAQYGRCKKT
jgi:hypothetical protein